MLRESDHSNLNHAAGHVIIGKHDGAKKKKVNYNANQLCSTVGLSAVSISCTCCGDQRQRNCTYWSESLIGSVIDSGESLNQWSYSFCVCYNPDTAQHLHWSMAHTQAAYTHKETVSCHSSAVKTSCLLPRDMVMHILSKTEASFYPTYIILCAFHKSPKSLVASVSSCLCLLNAHAHTHIELMHRAMVWEPDPYDTRTFHSLITSQSPALLK